MREFETTISRRHLLTSAGAAQFFLVNTAVEDPAPGKAMNLFVVAPEEVRAVSVREVWDAMGMRANSSNDLVFDACFLPADARLGEHGAGMSVMRLRPGGVPMGLAAIPVRTRGSGARLRARARAHACARQYRQAALASPGDPVSIPRPP